MYTAQNYKHLLGLAGFSDKALETHFILYDGYVANTNKLMGEMDALIKDNKESAPQFSELKRRFGWEFNGMRLHELYFTNLTKNGSGLSKSSKLYKKIENDFGSLEGWEKDFRATASMRGVGWVVMFYDQVADKLLNVWINEHNAGHLVGATPILVCDVFEHAFIIDYGTKRADYISAFMSAVDWQNASNRFI